MPDAVAAHEITITRVFDAPRELVWEAWTDPDQLARWWGKRGWTALRPTIIMDVRPGGAFGLTSVNEEDGTEMAQEGVFREVVEPERLVLEESSEDAWHDGAVTTVTFTDLGGDRTEMRFRATVNTSDEMGAAAEAGMASSIERLAEHLESR
jgi:uncharacterized protein YndB with AHSA1/START domain